MRPPAGAKRCRSAWPQCCCPRRYPQRRRQGELSMAIVFYCNSLVALSSAMPVCAQLRMTACTHSCGCCRPAAGPQLQEGAKEAQGTTGRLHRIWYVYVYVLKQTVCPLQTMCALWCMQQLRHKPQNICRRWLAECFMSVPVPLDAQIWTG